MKTTRNAALLLSVMMAGGLAAALPAAAQSTFTVGVYDPTADVVAPFGTAGEFSGYEFQQVYDAGAITTAANAAGPFTISSLGFMTDGSQGAVPETVTFNDLTIGLSNTDQTTTNTSTDFATNKGSNYTTVFSGNLTANLMADGSYDLVIPTSSFVFDPNAGNLLLDVMFSSETDSAGANDLEFFSGDVSPATSSVYDQGYGNSPDVAQGFGLVTQFTTVAPTPEPSSLTVLAFGAGAAALLIARKRRASAV